MSEKLPGLSLCLGASCTCVVLYHTHTLLQEETRSQLLPGNTDDCGKTTCITLSTCSTHMLAIPKVFPLKPHQSHFYRNGMWKNRHKNLTIHKKPPVSAQNNDSKKKQEKEEK